MLAITGLPGSGKSTLAQTAADVLGHRYVSRTWIGQAMFTTPHLSPIEFKASSACALLAAETNALNHFSSILEDTEFIRPGAYEALVASAYRVGAHPHYVYLACSVDLAIARTAAALADGSPATPSRTPLAILDLAEQIRQPPPDALILDASLPIDTQVHNLANAISAWHDQRQAS
jgi:predicted kinase